MLLQSYTNDRAVTLTVYFPKYTIKVMFGGSILKITLNCSYFWDTVKVVFDDCVM